MIDWLIDWLDIVLRRFGNISAMYRWPLFFIIWKIFFLTLYLFERWRKAHTNSKIQSKSKLHTTLLSPPESSLLSSASSNRSVPNSKTPSNWVFKGWQNDTATLMINNIKVLIYKYDIVNVCNVDIIVLTENQQVAGNGKLAKAILQKAGVRYRTEHTKLHSSQKRNWTDVLQTT